MKKLIFTIAFISWGINCFSQTVQSYLDSANMVMVLGDTMKIHYLNKAINLQPNNPELYSKRAYIKQHTRTPDGKKIDHEGAIRDLTEAIKLDSKNSYYYRERALNKFRISNYSGAIIDISKAIEISPENAYYYDLRGGYKEKKNDFYGALSDYTKAIQLAPETCEYYESRGNLYLDLEKFEKAITDYSKGISIAKTSNCFYNSEKIKKHFLSRIYNNRAFCKYVVDDLFGCISDCNMVITLSNDLPSYFSSKDVALIYIGLSKIELGKKEEGCLSLSKAGELGNEQAFEYIKEYCQ